MLVIAELALSSPTLLLTPTIEANPEARVSIEFQPAMDPERRQFFVLVDGADFAAFDDALADDYTVAAPTVVAERDGVRMYRLELTEDVVAVTPRVSELGGMVLEMHSTGGVWFVKLQVPERDALAAFREFCADSGIEYRLERLYRTQPTRTATHGLTEQQRHTLLTAAREGYFEVPREISQADLAAKLGVSDSAVSQRVRRAVAALIERTLAADPEPVDPS
ncbi:helix-turn-helix domain-containing protein [Halorientalis halophila]|uniref:helix-turn-helix domain-containing protein n=1 Tax=Halorientalis halophila TaxID=3108499 RepID=UPI00300B7CA7